MNWDDITDLMGCDDPDEVEAAFERGEQLVGVALLGLSLSVPDADRVGPLVVRALQSDRREVRLQGLTALGHIARLTGRVDQLLLNALRALMRNPDSEIKEHAGMVADDIWIFVPHSQLPWWMRARSVVHALGWWFVKRWWDITEK
ncbi:hypothetical protein Sru01_18420 [Sphaerisporangium rufum]|uniref:HEAT repeat domain-containing protein n=1 Tax=Sphaerisporangium rufum TaxID=1381558 RepID=A0A919V433_9ACTN|nr:hypothetical protein [Sphaerisporangium rufum]GII76860.1 hypothetical protein Sru01_18420 [Sphaerisporangium rufum]